MALVLWPVKGRKTNLFYQAVYPLQSYCSVAYPNFHPQKTHSQLGL